MNASVEFESLKDIGTELRSLIDLNVDAELESWLILDD